jgi:IclR family transcriptional regulator, KDG regulon repressor
MPLDPFSDQSERFFLQIDTFSSSSVTQEVIRSLRVAPSPRSLRVAPSPATAALDPEGRRGPTRQRPARTMSPAPEALYVARTMQVLELLAFQPLSAPQVAATLQIHPRTARRVLVRLHDEGYLSRSEGTRRRYSPTMRIVALAAQIVARSPLTTRALPVVAQVREETAADAHLAVPSYLSVLCVVHAGAGCSARIHPRELLPAHCAATGKALLAWRQGWRDSVLGHELERRTARTIVDPAALAREADATRSRGYAIDVGELQDGVTAVAAPVLVDGDAVAALGASASELDVETVGERLAVLAAELGQAVTGSNG